MKPIGFFALLGLLATLLFAASPALAHANLVRSEPPANSAQKVPPTRVRLWFSEEVEPSFSSATVLDKSGAAVDRHDSHRLSDDPKALEVSLTKLPEGLYTVVWNNLSMVDGHVTSGSFAFTVGAAPLPESSPREVMSSVDAALSASALPPTYQIAVRWLNVLLLALLVGSFTFPPLILLPSLRATQKQQPLLARVYSEYAVEFFRPKKNMSIEKTDPALGPWSPRWLRFTQFVFVSYAVVTAAVLIVQAFAVGDGFAAMGRVITATRFGAVWLFRVTIMLALGIVIFRARWLWTLNARRNRPLLLAAALGLMLLFAQSLSSHSAAVNEPPFLPLLADLIHLLGVVIWVGGLFQLLITLPALLRPLTESQRSHTLSNVIASFSLVAFLTVGIIILSGVYDMAVQVGSLEAFFNTLYGTTLFVKFLLVVPLLALAALNLIVNRPASAQMAMGHIRPFVRRFNLAVAFEVILAVTVLLAAGVLVSVAPARGAYNPLTPLWVETRKADDLRVTLGIAPGLVGTNDFDVKLQAASGQPFSNAPVVRLLVRSLEMDMGIQEVAVKPQGNGHYTARGDLISMTGAWQIEVLVRRAGHDDARTTFSLVALGQRAPRAAQPAILQSTQAQAGLGLTLFGLAFGTASVLLVEKCSARRANLALALAVSALGVAMIYHALQTLH